MDKYLKNNRTYQALLIIIVIITSIPIFSTYGFMDDYRHIWESKLPNFIDFFIQSGRPLFGILNQWFYEPMHAVEQLVYLRILGLAGLCVVIIQLFSIMKRFGYSTWQIVSIIIVFNASYFTSVTICWATTYMIFWAMAAAIASGSILFKAVNPTNKGNAKSISIIAAAILSIVSLMLYQAIYPAFILPWFLYTLKNFVFDKPTITRSAYTIVFHGCMYVVYFALFKVSLILTHLPNLERASISLELYQKLHWFVFTVFPKALQFGTTLLDAKVSVIVAIVCATVIVLYIIKTIYHKDFIQKIGFLLFIGGSLVMSFLPNFVSAESWASYRIMGALTFILTVLFIMAVENTYLSRVASRVLISGIILLSIATSLYTNYSVVDVCKKEYAILKQELTANVIEKVESGTKIIAPQYYFLINNNKFKKYVSDEFVVLSSSYEWIATPMVKQIMYENTGNFERINKITPQILFPTSNQARQEIPKEHQIDLEIIFKENL